MNRLSALVCTSLLLTAMLAGCASWPTQLKTPEVPSALAVPSGKTLTLIAHANGVQIYTCSTGSNEASSVEWKLKAPEADLMTSDGKVIAKHYAGPTWEANDGSKVAGKVKTSVKSDDANAIAWLLLDASANSGPGLFMHTTAIQRIHTVNGKAPADGCTQAHIGKEVSVAYQADYYFYD